jgi:hypothetical protein
MSVDTVLKGLIAPLVAGGCHNGVNASATITKPYVVFHEISAIPENGLLGYMGLTRFRYQVDVFAVTIEQAKALALGTIKAAIVGSSLEGLLIAHMAGEYSDLDKTHQYTTEYQIWAP